MALANNPLLTALTAAKAQKASAGNTVKAPDPVKDKASSFSSVFAKQAAPKSGTVDDSPAKPVGAKSSAVDSKHSPGQSSAASGKTVADNGNGLPAKTVNDKANSGADSDRNEHSNHGGCEATTNSDSADATVTGPAPDATLVVTSVLPEPAQPVAEQQPVLDPALLANAGAGLAPPMLEARTDPGDEQFDPSADPLAGLTAVQMALENKAQQAAHASGAANDAGKAAGKQDPNADPTQLLAGNLAALGDDPVEEGGTDSSSDKAFSSLLDDGLKDVSGAGSDTRVDNFAERLAALSQAAQAKTGSATPAPLLHQPLAMNQSGWTEGVINRVMYLSSQSLKQADIQLEPAELGRLDIRVNMAADQQTQVTFMSAHVGVREALESQMSRLRDSFAQQGMGQVDVNVSDQSRGWQQQAQQQSNGDGQRGSGASGSNGAGGGDLIADGAPPVDAATAAANAPLSVVGSSVVDYYA